MSKTPKVSTLPPQVQQMRKRLMKKYARPRVWESYEKQTDEALYERGFKKGHIYAGTWTRPDPKDPTKTKRLYVVKTWDQLKRTASDTLDKVDWELEEPELKLQGPLMEQRNEDYP